MLVLTATLTSARHTGVTCIVAFQPDVVLTSAWVPAGISHGTADRKPEIRRVA